MNRSFIIWNVLLTAGLLFLGVSYFSSGGKARSLKSNSPGTFSMAYFEMDSIETNFNLVKELKEELSKKEQSMEQEMQKMAGNAQQRYNYYQQQASTGLMNESQSEAAGDSVNNITADLIKGLNERYKPSSK